MTLAKANTMNLGDTAVLPKGTKYTVTVRKNDDGTITSYATVGGEAQGFDLASEGTNVFLNFPESANGKTGVLTMDTTLVVAASSAGLMYWTIKR